MENINDLFRKTNRVVDPFALQHYTEKDLFERSMQSIRSMDIPDPQEVSDFTNEELLNLWEYQLELEYKYNMIANRPFNGIPERKKRVLSLIETKATDINVFLAETFIRVFDWWINLHDYTNPQQFAKYRTEEIYEDFDEQNEPVMKFILNDSPIEDLPDKLVNMVLEEPNRIPLWSEFIRTITTESMRELAWEQVSELENREEEVEASDFDFDFLYNNPKILDSSTPLQTAKNVINNLEFEDVYEYEDFWYLEDPDEVVTLSRNVGIHPSELVEEVFSTLYIDHFVSNWPHVLEVVSKIKDKLDELMQITEKPLPKQFVIINTAKNMNHQTGSMIEYYEDFWGLTEEDFSDMSDSVYIEQQAEKWTQELRDMGVEI